MKNKFILFLFGILALLQFMVIVIFYVLNLGIVRILPNFLKNGWNAFYDFFMNLIDREKIDSFNHRYLIELSLKNMKAKKTRTIVTMGGMAIGIAFIVFLVSVGYGLQNMVVTRVARLDELKQTDIVPGLSADLVLNDETMTKFRAIPNVSLVLPVIAVVGKVSYQNSVSDMAVYGVTSDYLKNSAIQPVKGKIFEDDNLTVVKNSSEMAKIKTIEEKQTDVLGITSDNTTGSLPIVNIASESANLVDKSRQVMELSSSAKRVAVINRSSLSVLNLSENDAVGKKVNMSFVVVGEDSVESLPTEYLIVGVTPDEGSPMIFVPFIDLRSLGIEKYSQLKLIVTDKNVLSTVRANIEANGYGTISVADTVAQIDNLFVSFRLVLGILGMVALSVAALGMFNTLTVSLLERTREVGLMKAMGMKANEVKDLFLTESMIMGFFGGVMGLILGSVIGKILSLILTAFSLVKGIGAVDISYVPLPFIFIVMGLSVVVGVLTGYFPAKRATKISALNALRYE